MYIRFTAISLPLLPFFLLNVSRRTAQTSYNEYSELYSATHSDTFALSAPLSFQLLTSTMIFHCTVASSSHS